MGPYAWYREFGVSAATYERARDAEATLAEVYAGFEARAECHQLRVIRAFQEVGVSEAGFAVKTGYGYGDLGRRQTEAVFASAFGAEAALVRVQFSSGTQVLATCLRALLNPGDDVLIATGMPYDTLLPTFGRIEQAGETCDYSSSPRTLASRGVSVRAIDLTAEQRPDTAALAAALKPETRMVYVQRSRGYTVRRALTFDDMTAIAQTVRRHAPHAILFADNCYGEFTERDEPLAAGFDLIAGSLIKNPGADIAPSGGYVCGRARAVEAVAEEMTAVGVGAEVGPSLGQSRLLLQGLYFAPRVTADALANAAFAAALFERAGFEVAPRPEEVRGDIVQCIRLGSRERLIAFCEAIQKAAPVDSFALPVPSPMPGYDCDIIMASGSFIQGSSIELSADGPLREPYVAFLQGGLNRPNGRLGAMLALEAVHRADGGRA